MMAKIRNAKGFTLVELMVVVAILGIIMAIGIPYYNAYKRSTCDRAATADILRLAAAGGRMGSELVDLNMNFQSAMNLTNFNVLFFKGDFYGWHGTNNKCQVMMAWSATNMEAYACAWKGSVPTGAGTPNDRYIYVSKIEGGRDAVAQVGNCVAGAAPGIASPPADITNLAEYGGSTDCTNRSMIDPTGFVIKTGLAVDDCSFTN